jgi:hypothetical protein
LANNSVSVQAKDDVATVCAISLRAAILTNFLHEGLGHAATALLTGTKSGVLIFAPKSWTKGTPTYRHIDKN